MTFCVHQDRDQSCIVQRIDSKSKKMKTYSNDFQTKIPQDILFHILTKLPTKSLVQLRCVSKFFKSIISHPHFLNLHFSTQHVTHHLLYYESIDYTYAYFSFIDSLNFSVIKHLETPFKSINGYLRLVGCVKGLVCLFDTNYFNYVGTLILWNPFIGKFKILAFDEGFSSFGERVSHMVVGFGFDVKDVDFIVVNILYNENGVKPRSLVYRSKMGCWRSIESEVPCFMRNVWSRNVFANGVVYWLAYTRYDSKDIPDCIMGFDVVNEVFKVMDLPKNLGQSVKELQLSTLVDEKSLVLFTSVFKGLTYSWGVWLMTDCGKLESWTKVYDVVLMVPFVPVRIVSNCQFLASIDEGNLILIDVVMVECKYLAVYGLPLTFCTSGYTPSLALLEDGKLLM